MIIDEELRLPTDITFPIDALTSTVNTAPTSSAVVVIDDEEAIEVREATQKRKLRKRTRYLIAGSSIFAVFALVMIVLASPIIAVRHVDVEGSKYMSKDLLSIVQQSLLGKPLLTVDTEKPRVDSKMILGLRPCESDNFFRLGC